MHGDPKPACILVYVCALIGELDDITRVLANSEKFCNTGHRRPFPQLGGPDYWAPRLREDQSLASGSISQKTQPWGRTGQIGDTIGLRGDSTVISLMNFRFIRH